MTPHIRPSRLARAALRWTASADEANAVLGDIAEELDERAALGRPPRWPSIWMEIQAWRFAAAGARTSLARTARACHHTVRDAARSLLRQPGHALVILLVLGTGISAATVTFTVVDRALFRPLQLDPEERVVNFRMATSKFPRRPTDAEIRAIKDSGSSVAPLADYTVGSTSGAVDDVSQTLHIATVSPEFFPLLALRTQIGRVWTEADVAGNSFVTVITDALWRQKFNSDPGVLGRQVTLADGPRAIIGVLTPESDAALAEVRWRTQAFVPSVQGIEWISTEGRGPILKLQSGVTLPDATRMLEAILAPLAPQGTGADPAWGVVVAPWRTALVRTENVRDWMLLVLGAVGLIVLIACVNAATVLLTRSTARTHELAVRASLGATRRALAGSMLAESLLLSAAAAACALTFAAWGLEWVRSVLPPNVPRISAMSVDGRVFGAAVVAAFATGLLFGIIPAWDASRASVSSLLKDGGPTTTGNRRWRSALLVAQVGCVAVLLVISTLFVVSFARVASTDLGLDRSNLISVSMVSGYEGTVTDVKARFARIPGVTSVAAVGRSTLPLVSRAYGGAQDSSTLRSVEVQRSANVKAEIYRVTPDYFDVARIAFRSGAPWSVPPSPSWNPVVVDSAVALALFGDEPAVGRVIEGTRITEPLTIVGVVAPTMATGPEGVRQPTAYLAMAPSARPSWVGFFLRTAGPPEALLRAVDTELAAIARPSISAGAGVHVVDDAYRALTSTRRFTGTLMALFAAIQMLIGAAGIYAVTASVVAQQTREFGVRVALGATARDIRRGVLARAAKHVLLGLAIGLPVAWWISRGFASLFFGVRPTDASVYVLVSALLLSSGLLAAAIPAWRAARVDPIKTLRAG